MCVCWPSEMFVPIEFFWVCVSFSLLISRWPFVSVSSVFVVVVVVILFLLFCCCLNLCFSKLNNLFCLHYVHFLCGEYNFDVSTNNVFFSLMISINESISVFVFQCDSVHCFLFSVIFGFRQFLIRFFLSLAFVRYIIY